MNNPEKLIKLGDDKYNSWSSYWLGYNINKYDEAVEYYRSAKNIFQSQKNYDKAIETSNKIILSLEKCKYSVYELEKEYVSLAELYKKIEDDRYVWCYEQATHYALEKGEFKNAGLYQQKIAEYYLLSPEKLQLAIEVYKNAIQYHENTGYNHNIRECLIKISELHRQLKQYYLAVDSYISLIKSYQKDNIGKFFIDKPIFCAMMCALATEDIEYANRIMVDLAILEPRFEGSHLYDNIVKVLSAVEERNIYFLEDVIRENITFFKEIPDLLPIIKDQCNSLT